ncbi:MAG: formylglycine-generating enzyme family protein [Bacteroidales bacterium]|nr:formylglycine-generating enzyme family protein [Bacteroidales bacterium]
MTKRFYIALALLVAAPALVFAQQTQSPLTITVKGVSFNMIRVQGGTFTMGCTSEQGNDCYGDEKPAHTVTLSTYYIGETEVTQELWKAVMGDNPSYFKSGSLKRPVENVSWEDCQTFIRRLNELTGKKFRLPTEAEWEFAARGGTKSAGYKYSGSNDINAVAWYWKNAGTKGESSPDYGTHVVKTKKPNELGIYDMSGNVWEWCSDWCGDYTGATQTNPQGASSGSNRVYRGGGWYNDAGSCRSSYRNSYAPGLRRNFLGLRLVLIP